LHTPFTFNPTTSPKANAFLKLHAEHLLTLNAAGQRVFIKSALTFAKALPLDSVQNAMVKAQVVMTLRRWLDEVQEAA